MQDGVITVEPAFLLERWQRLERLSWVDASLTWTFLSREIHRCPQSLALHLCRIRAGLEMDAEAVYAALVDLVLTLGTRGRRLQRRMILGSRKWLAPLQSKALHRYLAGHLSAAELPFSPRSILQPGIIGKMQAITSQAGERRPPIDFLQAARDCLALGQLEQARELFEQVLLNNPGCLEGRQELLSIYRALKDKENFTRMYTHLQRYQCVDPAWDAFGRTLSS